MTLLEPPFKEDGVALSAARRAVELTDDGDASVQAAHLDTLALAEFRAGNVESAIARQREAISHLEPGSMFEAEFRERLTEYTSASD